MNKNSAGDNPIACALSTGDLAKREEAWRRLLATSVLAQERVPGGLRLIVGAGAGEELNALIDAERICCSWITFAVDGESVTMTAPGDGEEVLVHMFSVDALSR